MSIETWKAEFYPISAQDCPKEEAARHSLKKWQGLTKANLKRHGISFEEGQLFDEGADEFWVDAYSCALCEHYDLGSMGCRKCPLSKARGDFSCCDERPDEQIDPFHAFTIDGNVRPMIRWLKKAVAIESKP